MDMHQIALPLDIFAVPSFHQSTSATTAQITKSLKRCVRNKSLCHARYRMKSTRDPHPKNFELCVDIGSNALIHDTAFCGGLVLCSVSHYIVHWRVEMVCKRCKYISINLSGHASHK